MTGLGVMPDERSAIAFLATEAAARAEEGQFEIVLHHHDGRMQRHAPGASPPER
jgi:hypothetical protein